MKIFSSFYRITSSVLMLTFSMSIPAISLDASQKDTLEEILKAEIFTEKSQETEYSFKKISKNIPYDTNTSQEISRNPEISDISSAEVQRILEIVVQEPEVIAKKIAPEKCVIPAKIPEEIEHQFAQAIENIPCDLLQSLRKVEIFDDPKHIFPRAMANGRILKIRSDTIEQPEFVSVLIHELGHVVDLGGLKSQNFLEKSRYKDGKKIIYADDKSVLFYELSWEDEYTKKPEISDLDFVGGYASYDMFEDYAEAFLMYIKYGNEFRMLAENNIIIQKKYNFFKIHVFSGKEFATGSSQAEILKNIQENKRPWDITKL